MVAAIERLGRSVADVARTMAELGSRRITLRASRKGRRYGSPTGRAVAAIMATLAELQFELGCERRAANRESRRAVCRPVEVSGDSSAGAVVAVLIAALHVAGEP